ncbi:hypothetical protein [Sphaerisporangium sp. TRM90804]|uniref:hypothetical protein n=1 Tax=Sphaerisporangium sp. TRM90804 TaxID=3031113 RepID=UPI002447C6C8|nr:hypothetical protein [Sphaerisporangium sp. TRM90804]MDH2425624.1 hypothetical protein [Sphaerisporangium sp. TRM90804]
MTARDESPPSPSLLNGDVTTSRPGRVADVVLRGRRRWARHLWWLALVAGAAGAAFVWLATPHAREIQTAWELVAKLLAFACLCVAIAFFPWVSPRLQWLVYIPFVFFTGYLIPRVSWFYFGDVARAQGDSFYTHLYLLLYPAIVLTVAAAYRIGGGSPGRCLKVMATGVVILFSGFLDLMWFVANPVAIPEVIDAPHINLFTGGPISFGMTILFALAHVPIVVGINLLPLDRWIARLLGAGELTPVR